MIWLDKNQGELKLSHCWQDGVSFRSNNQMSATQMLKVQVDL